MSHTDDWFLQCPQPLPEWELTVEEETVYYKIQRKIDNWLKQEINSVNTVSCQDGKFRPELHYD
jgi:hypothetical protein